MKTLSLLLLAIPLFGAKLGYISHFDNIYENGSSLVWESSPFNPIGYRFRGTWTTPLGSKIFDVAIDGGSVLFTPDMLVLTGSLTGDPVYFTIRWSDPKELYCCADGWPIPSYPAAGPDYVQERDGISFAIKNYWVYRQWHLVYWGPDQSRIGSIDTFEEQFYFLTPEPGTVGLFALGGVAWWLRKAWRRPLTDPRRVA